MQKIFQASLFFEKGYYEVKPSSLQVSFNIFWSPHFPYNKSKLYKTLDN